MKLIHSLGLGDPRINLNPELTITEITFLRAHNRIAAILHKNHPSWDDENLFQEARRILIAFYKQISFAELIPAYIGKIRFFSVETLSNRKGKVISITFLACRISFDYEV